MINTEKLSIFIEKNKFFLILCLWIISSIFFYFYIYQKYGEPPRYGMFDWNRYYYGALSILDFKFPEWPSYYFLSYCIYLALSIKILFPYFTLALAILLNLFSTFLVYSITKKLFNNIAAIFCVIVFLFYPYYQMWVFFIQPVNFFSFCLLLVLFSVVNFEHDLKKIFILIFALILGLTARPNGISELISVYIFLIIFYFFLNKKISLLIFIVGIPIIYFILLFLSNSMSIMNVYDAWNLTEMHEFGYKNLQLNLGTQNFEKCLGLSSDQIINLNQDNAPASNLNFWICSILASPIDVIKIFIVRFFVTLSFYKPILSLKHNLFSLLTLLPLYIFFFIGFFNDFKLKKIFILLSLILVLSTISIHTVDGDNRVFSAFLPFVFILASGGFVILIKKLKLLS